MRNINSNNYEAYLLDYSEGNLTPQEVAELLLFMSENPELSNEFSDDQLPLLIPDENQYFNDKEALKALAPLPELDEGSAELYHISDIEKQLNENQTEELKGFLRNNPEQKRDHDLYQKTILKPEENISYEPKNSLYRTKVVSFKTFYQYSAVAASILLIISFGLFFNSGNDTMISESQQKEVLSAEGVNFAFQSNVSLVHPRYKDKKDEIQQPSKTLIAVNKEKPIQDASPSQELLSKSNPELIDTVIEIPIKSRKELAKIDTNQIKPIEEAIIEEEKLIAQNQSQKENTSNKPQPMRLNQYLKKVVGRKLLDTDEKMKAFEENKVEKLAVQIADDVVPNLEFKKNNEGEVLAYSFRIGSFGISRKSGKN